MQPLQPSVTDEWADLQVALVYPQLNTSLRCRHPDRTSVGEVGLADLLKYQGVELVIPDMPESVASMRVFARDPVTVIGQHVHTCMMTNIRYNEGQYSTSLMAARGVTSKPWGTHGGDVLVLGADNVLVGYGPTRPDTSEPWEEADESEMSHVRDRLQAIGVRTSMLCHDVMHLDCAVAPLPNGEILVDATALYPASLRRLQAQFSERMKSITSSGRLDFNLLWINPQTVVAPGYEHNAVKDHLRKLGYDIWHVSGSAEKGGGSARCAVAPLVRGARK